jgi:hypothetical protein
MEGIEEFLNRLNDFKDFGWWPFASLRRKPDEKMTTDYVAKIALVQGSTGGFVLSIVVILLGSLYASPPGFSDAAWFVVIFTVLITILITILFIPLYRLTFAVAWNRRAERLLADPAYGGVLPDEPFDPGAYGTYGVWVPRGPLRRSDDV